jgi:hypothetical protein
MMKMNTMTGNTKGEKIMITTIKKEKINGRAKT